MFYKNNSKKIINTKFSLVVCLLFLLYFFSNNLIYATSLTKTKNDFSDNGGIEECRLILMFQKENLN